MLTPSVEEAKGWNWSRRDDAVESHFLLSNAALVNFSPNAVTFSAFKYSFFTAKEFSTCKSK
uniref:Uncharacterized protein n=1 Tax=Anguilla anguilla TaxID=7936 RepID=A0A0E9WH76_ANGAN